LKCFEILITLCTMIFVSRHDETAAEVWPKRSTIQAAEPRVETQVLERLFVARIP
jgi:hypothetical protein